MALPPILISIIGQAVAGAVAGGLKQPSTVPNVIKTVTDSLAANPVVVNQMNAEKPVQSRVVVGSSVGGVAALGIVLSEIGTKTFPNYDWAVLLPALTILWGVGYALYGRLRSGLKPLFAGK